MSKKIIASDHENVARNLVEMYKGKENYDSEQVSEVLDFNLEKGFIDNELFCKAKNQLDTIEKGRGKTRKIGELDKSGNNIKTSNGWVPVKHAAKKHSTESVDEAKDNRSHIMLRVAPRNVSNMAFKLQDIHVNHRVEDPKKGIIKVYTDPTSGWYGNEKAQYKLTHDLWVDKFVVNESVNESAMTPEADGPVVDLDKEIESVNTLGTHKGYTEMFGNDSGYGKAQKFSDLNDQRDTRKVYDGTAASRYLNTLPVHKAYGSIKGDNVPNNNPIDKKINDYTREPYILKNGNDIYHVDPSGYSYPRYMAKIEGWTPNILKSYGVDIEKAGTHKYFKREGTPGKYKYYYTENEYNEAKGKDHAGVKGTKMTINGIGMKLDKLSFHHPGDDNPWGSGTVSEERMRLQEKRRVLRRSLRSPEENTAHEEKKDASAMKASDKRYKERMVKNKEKSAKQKQLSPRQHAINEILDSQVSRKYYAGKELDRLNAKIADLKEEHGIKSSDLRRQTEPEREMSSKEAFTNKLKSNVSKMFTTNSRTNYKVRKVDDNNITLTWKTEKKGYVPSKGDIFISTADMDWSGNSGIEGNRFDNAADLVRQVRAHIKADKESIHGKPEPRRPKLSYDEKFLRSRGHESWRGPNPSNK